MNRRHFAVFTFACASALVLGGCGSDDPAQEPSLDVTPALDTASDDGGTEDVDASPDLDVDDDDIFDPADTDAGTVRLGFGELCTEDTECEGFLCLRIDAGEDAGICSGFCGTSEDCPEDGWDCVFLANSGADAALVCVPDNLCIDRDDDGYGVGPGCLGPDCEDDNDAVSPGADEVCDGQDNDCDGNIDDNPVDTNRDCSSGFSGVCEAGRSFCDAGVLDCVSLRAPTTEQCDGLDNDCDGLVDEGDDGDALTERCYAGPPGTVNIGECRRGTRTCTDTVFGGCEGQVLPNFELCDGLDNDCDGEIDEGNPGEGVVCDTGLDGLCSQGITVCSDAGLSCIARFEASEEVCDGQDNDCDGLIDEGADGETLSRVCYDGDESLLGIGVCQSGTQTCVDGEFGRCAGQVLPSIEICDELDNNCDGVVNDGNPAGGFLCETGQLGLCAFGRTECGGTDERCVPDFAPSVEICDGFDNDCDGEIDEADAGGPLTRSCYDGPAGTAGNGQCTGGAQTCNFGDWGGCVGQVTPAVELCDGRDNNCDGAIDDGNPGSGIACTTGAFGQCNAGFTACVDGGPQCVATEVPEPEVCDGQDNDCDGEVDNAPAFATLGEVCFAGEGVCQAAGVFVCNPDDPSGAPVCNATPRVGSTEVCDGLDNDCDGSVDEDVQWADRGAVCFAGQGVCEASGVLICNSSDRTGPLVCSATPGTPSSEVCDGLDNDCDGQRDEGALWSDVGSVCFEGEGSCRAAGVRVCDASNPAGASVCSATPGTPTAEVCDGADNDCDGSVDEGTLWADRGEVCSVGRGTCEAVGTLACNAANPAGPLACSAVAGTPTTEVCDGLDNNCNGVADEGPLWADKGQGCLEGQGQCLAAGVLVCDSSNPGGGLTCSAEPGSPVTDICDGLDNNCNGDVDEEFPTLGDTCFAGAGVCRAAGVVVCDTDVTVRCDAVPLDPGITSEAACDYLDDDCDGQIDEDFRTGVLYTQVENCGGCGVNCSDLWDGGPAAFNVVPICQASALLASCSYTCAAGAFDLDLDPSNGCEFRPELDTVYVSTPENGGSDILSCGAYSSPCATIGYAISTRAPAIGAARVRVSSGEYRENVTLSAGVDVLGGHNATNWVRQPSLSPSVISGLDGALDNIAVQAAGIATATEFSGFTVNAAPGGDGGGNSIGVLLTDAPGVTVRDNTIVAADGGRGLDGVAGNSGRDGGGGSGGSGYQTTATCPGTTISGGSRGTVPGGLCPNPDGVGTTDTRGGAGATSSCPVAGAANASGNNGSGPLAPGGGGAGGGFAVGTGTGGGGRTCSVDTNLEFEATGGQNGGRGSDGGGGANPGAAGGGLAAGLWRGATGLPGANGAHGSGGGGGGAAAGVDASGFNGTFYVGASGGGGGAGGCAASAGGGGTAGGGSFAVKIVFTGSGPSSSGAMPQVFDNRLRRGRGGRGGSGGNGGSGGEPGLGGVGGSGVGTDDFAFCMLDGGAGGAGGRGGHGGGGAGGAGGVSFDLYVFNSNGNDPGYSANTNILGGLVNTAGAGGQGGGAIVPSSVGASGPAGLSDTFFVVP